MGQNSVTCAVASIRNIHASKIQEGILPVIKFSVPKEVPKEAEEIVVDYCSYLGLTLHNSLLTSDICLGPTFYKQSNYLIIIL